MPGLVSAAAAAWDARGGARVPANASKPGRISTSLRSVGPEQADGKVDTMHVSASTSSATRVAPKKHTSHNSALEEHASSNAAADDCSVDLHVSRSTMLEKSPLKQDQTPEGEMDGESVSSEDGDVRDVEPVFSSPAKPSRSSKLASGAAEGARATQCSSDITHDDDSTVQSSDVTSEKSPTLKVSFDESHATSRDSVAHPGDESEGQLSNRSGRSLSPKTSGSRSFVVRSTSGKGVLPGTQGLIRSKTSPRLSSAPVEPYEDDKYVDGTSSGVVKSAVSGRLSPVGISPYMDMRFAGLQSTSLSESMSGEEDTPIRLLPVVAVLGAETFIGTHIILDLLRRRNRRVRAVVTSNRSIDFLSSMEEARDYLEEAMVGDLSQHSSFVPLRGALRGVRYCIFAQDLRGDHATVSATSSSVDGVNSTTRGNPSVVRFDTDSRARWPVSRVADRASAAARAVADAVGAPGATITRFVHVGSDTAVFDPRTASSGGDIELDENCWYDVSDDGRRGTEGEAFGATAAEMLLWARASSDRVQYSMCSVIPALMLGPMITPGHAGAAGQRLLVDYMSKMHAVAPIPTPVVDCREVAWCVGSLVTSHEHVCGRVLMMSESLTSTDIISECKRLYPLHPWPARTVPKWAVGPGTGIPWRMTRRAIRLRYGMRYALSQRRAVREIGVTFRSASESLQDTISSLSDFGAVDLGRRRSRLGGARGRISSRLLRTSRQGLSGRKTVSGRV